jgi:uncharacterized heparinase superfamily protein
MAGGGFSGRTGKMSRKLALWRAGRVRTATGFVGQPEPRSMGLDARGKQLISGNFLFGGGLIEMPGAAIWDIAQADTDAAAEVHGFAWLDDLAAVGDAAARGRAQDWTWDWIDRFGRGQGPGWTPELTGRRITRLINHAFLLLSGRDAAQSAAYFRLLTTQTVFLSRTWGQALPGLPRFEALTGMISAGLALTGMGDRVGPAIAALAADCRTGIDREGGIPTRNPEDLLEVFTLLTWATQSLSEAGRAAPTEVLEALERIAPTLRALRHADGGLARFHGGGRGIDGRLDQALAQAGVRAVGGRGQGVRGPEGPGLAMGFARLAGGRTSVIIDAAAPPGDRAGMSAHAGTCAFEMTSGRRPVIVNCGSGVPFGAEWGRAGRATPSHSTLAVDGFSSSRLASDGGETLVDRAGIVVLRQTGGPDGMGIHLAHDGWSETHGLSHVRDLALSSDGRRLSGIDSLACLSTLEKRWFERVMTDGKLAGVGFVVRFHLHPDVDAGLDMGGTAVSLALKSGEIWVFRHDGSGVLSLEPSVYLEKGRLQPRGTRAIVLTARATDFETRLGWTLAKAQDTPLAIRDLERGEGSVAS